MRWDAVSTVYPRDICTLFVIPPHIIRTFCDGFLLQRAVQGVSAVEMDCVSPSSGNAMASMTAVTAQMR